MIPGLALAAFEEPDIDWNFRSIPQVHFPVESASNGERGFLAADIEF